MDGLVCSDLVPATQTTQLANAMAKAIHTRSMKYVKYDS